MKKDRPAGLFSNKSLFLGWGLEETRVPAAAAATASTASSAAAAATAATSATLASLASALSGATLGSAETLQQSLHHFLKSFTASAAFTTSAAAATSSALLKPVEPL